MGWLRLLAPAFAFAVFATTAVPVQAGTTCGWDDFEQTCIAEYYGGAGDSTLASPATLAMCIGPLGAACFHLFPNSFYDNVRLTIHDQLGLPVGAYVAMFDGGQNLAESFRFCGAWQGSVQSAFGGDLLVLPDGPVAGAQDCPGQLGVGTVGYVQLDFLDNF